MSDPAPGTIARNARDDRRRRGLVEPAIDWAEIDAGKHEGAVLVDAARRARRREGGSRSASRVATTGQATTGHRDDLLVSRGAESIVVRDVYALAAPPCGGWGLRSSAG